MTDGRLSVEERQDLLSLMPAAVAVVRGPEHVFAFANDRYRRLVRGRDVVGLPCAVALPESGRQGFVELLDRVYESGLPYVAHEVPFTLDDETGSTQLYLNFAYLPLVEDDGSTSGILAHVVDVTELVEARENAQSLARTLEVIFDQMPSGAVIAEAPSGRLTMANRVWRDFFGVPLDAAQDIESYAVFSGRDAEGNEYSPERYPLARSLASGEVVYAERIDFHTPDGRTRTTEVSSTPIHDESGAIVSGVATFADVTSRRWADELLRDQNRVLELIASGAPLADALEALVAIIESRVSDLAASVLLMADDGRHLLHGAAPSLPAAYNEAIHGIEIGPAVGSCGTAAFRGERVIVEDIDTDPLWADFRELALAHGLRACWSTPVKSPEGDVLGTFAVYYDAPRAPRPLDLDLIELVNRTAAIAIQRDRLERRQARALAAEHAARTEAERRAQAAFALEQVDDGVALVDDTGAILVWNQAAVDITGTDADAARGCRLDELMPGWEPPERLLPTGRHTFPVELHGREHWLEASASAFDGGVVFTFRDVTDERALDVMRNDMIATVSHELRTPVTAVYGAAKTLERSDVASNPELSHRLFEIVKSESTRLVALVEEILLASRVDSGSLSLSVRGVDVLEAVQESVARLQDDGVRATVEGEPATVVADPGRLRQVLDNLVDNAVKYGGGIAEVAVAPEGETVQVRVADRGPGIAPGERRRIFDKFVRLDPNMAGGVPGTGLGLYISRELVERMQGRIWVESRLDGGRGAVFVVSLPAA